MDFKAIGSNLKQRKIWIWIVLPLLMDAFSIGLSITFLPEYINHVLMRAGAIVSFDNLPFLVVQLSVLALGEEIAWRAFFQKQLQKTVPIAPTLIITSVLFALGHLPVEA